MTGKRKRSGLQEMGALTQERSGSSLRSGWQRYPNKSVSLHWSSLSEKAGVWRTLIPRQPLPLNQHHSLRTECPSEPESEYVACLNHVLMSGRPPDSLLCTGLLLRTDSRLQWVQNQRIQNHPLQRTRFLMYFQYLTHRQMPYDGLQSTFAKLRLAFKKVKASGKMD